MKLAVQADFFLKTYGLEEGLKRMKAIGYENATLEINERYDGPFTTQWKDEEISAKYAPMGKAFADAGIKLLYAVLKPEIFNDYLPGTYEARKKMAIQIVKACYYLGCKTLAVKPVTFNKIYPQAKKAGKSLAYEVFDPVKAECDRLGIAMIVINAGTRYESQSPYGSSVKELKELCERYGAKVSLSPRYAATACQNAAEMIADLGDLLYGVVIEDVEAIGKTGVLPMMGSLDFSDLTEALRSCSDETVIVMASKGAFDRFKPFLKHEELFDALYDFTFTMGQKFASCNKEGN